ncbi:MAG TPA: radical SAM protein [Candidatus Margulisiibacteriota bacterium]|nr:radical SAM protein [Candidatus Margulisiibacteriota bacterium]
MQLTKRIDLNLGYSCNIKCSFCYYQKSMRCAGKEARHDLSTQEAKKWLLFFRRKGLEAIDLTGGEPTIRDDIAELISYAREIGYKKICIITNGLRLADEALLARLVESGLNDILFSLHGPNRQIHEALTQTPGSFDKLLKAFANARASGLRMKSNTVVNGISYRYVEETAELLYGLGVRVVNFILFNPIIEAKGSGSDMNVDYIQAAPYLSRTIDAYKDKLDKITLRYIPFCVMPGYEQYITNTPQIQYDPDEWDYYWRTYFRNGIFLWAGAIALGSLLHPRPLRLASLDFNTAKHEAIKWALAFVNKTKGRQCKGCAYYMICDGLWRGYAKKKGFSELIPFMGKRISDPAYFMTQNKQFKE